MSSQEDEIYSIIDNHFGEKVHTLTPIQTGSQSAVYQVTAEREYLVKVLPNDSKQTCHRLQNLYNYILKNTHCPVPKILLIKQSTQDDTTAFVVQNYQQGLQLRHIIESTTSTNVSASIFSNVYQYMTNIWRLPVAEVESFWIPTEWDQTDTPSWEQYINSEIQATRLFLQNTFHGDAVLSSITLLEELDSTAIEYMQLVPLHGDLIPENIIVNDNGAVVRILDFERARIGERVWDLVYFEGKLSHYDESLARLWKDCYWNELNDNEKNRYYLFSSLFHTWTMRDGWDQPIDSRLYFNAQRSYQILTNSNDKTH